jgi:hypothetical protein
MLKRLILSLTMLFALVALAPVPAHAADLFQGADCSGDKTSKSAVCNSKVGQNDNPVSGTNGVILKITKIVAYIAGAAAVIVIMVGAIRYITAGGSAEKASSAKSTVINAMIGLAIIVLAASIISFVLNRI